MRSNWTSLSLLDSEFMPNKLDVPCGQREGVAIATQLIIEKPRKQLLGTSTCLSVKECLRRASLKRNGGNYMWMPQCRGGLPERCGA